MVDLLVRHRILALFSLAAIVAMAGALVWWTTSEDVPISAQEMMEDVCASVTYPESFDITVQASANSDTGLEELLTTYRRGSQAEHYINYRGDGSPWIEGKFFYENQLANSESEPEGEISGASGTTTLRNTVIITAYTREFGDSGAWEDWSVMTSEQPAYDAATSAVVSGQSGTEDELSTFCGLPLEIEGTDIEFRYVGKETIDGVETDHYYHAYSPESDDSGSYIAKEFWLDADGLFRQVKEVVYNAPIEGSLGAERVESLKTYSGWGEPNVIATPVLPTPDPAPSATP